MSEYTAEDYINFIETGRRDKISPDALIKIAEKYRILENQKTIDNKDLLTSFIKWYWLNIGNKPNSSLTIDGIIECFIKDLK